MKNLYPSYHLAVVIKKILLSIPYFFLWVLYFFLTLKERNEYLVSESRGYKCIGSKDSGIIIPFTHTTYYFDPKQKPERDYITWREFWTQRGYFKSKTN